MLKVRSRGISYLIVLLMITISISVFQPAFSETVGARVTKIPYFQDNEASVAFEVCAGNNSLDKPKVEIISNLDSKIVELSRFINAQSCIGDAIKISATDPPSITATLVKEQNSPILIDNAHKLDQRTIQGMSNDGQVRVEVITDYPVIGEKMTINVSFLDVLGNPVEHVNYDIKAIQNGEIVFEKELTHTHDGKNTHQTKVLNSDEPVDFKVILEGLGLPEEEVKWQGPTGEIIFFHAVPEFGPIVLVIFTGSIIGVILASYKFRIKLQ